MVIIPFPVLCEYNNVLKRTKTTKIKSKNKKISKESKKVNSLILFDFLIYSEVAHKAYLNKGQ